MSEITTADTHPDYIGPIIVSEPARMPGSDRRELVPAVKRVSLWRGPDGGSFGDDSRGYVLTAIYVSGDGKWCAEVEMSPVWSEPSNAAVDDHALMQGATREEVADLSADALTERFGEPPGCYGVDQRTTIGEAVYEDGAEMPRPDDQADIDYEGGSALAFDMLEDAQREADRLGREDLSGYFNFKVKP